MMILGFIDSIQYLCFIVYQSGKVEPIQYTHNLLV